MKHFFTTRVLACLAVLLGLWPSLAIAAPFTPGNLVVMRVGDGSASLTTGSTAAYLQEYTPAGVLVQTIALPTAVSGNNRILTVAGSSSTDGGLTRSANGAYLVLGGYDIAPGTAAVSGTLPAATNRIVGRVAADGTVDTSTRLDDVSGNIRSAASVDGTSFYTSGSSGGAHYAPFGNAGSSVIVSATPSNLRYINTFGGNLYVSSGSSPYIGLSQIGTGLPTTAGQTATLLPGMQGTTSTTAGISPLAFYFADLSASVPGVDVVYVADDGATTAGGGIQKWSLVGTTWMLNGTITNSTAVRGLDGTTTGTTVSLVAAGNGGLYVVSDNAGYNAAPSTLTLPAPIATAGTNTAFRGATFAPAAVVATPAPTITSFTPTSGAAGATVTITGTNLTGATAVTLNGVAITGFTVVSGTTITFTVPATATTGTIAVTTPGGTVTSTGTFTFVPAAAAPTITSFTPASGAAGTTVTITGTNLTGATAVTLNGVAITGFTVVSGTTITFTVPATATTGTIAVTTPGGTVTSTGTFTFVPAASAPTITSFTPANGPVGTTVTITGTNFTGATGATLNGTAVTGFTVVSATSATFTVPATATSGVIAITTAAGTGTSTGTFTVTATAPTITSFTPTTGAAGVTVTITGTNFTNASAVTVGGVAITGFTVVNATTITFVLSATAVTGTIAVTTPGGTATSTGTFTVTPTAVTPVISTLTPGVQVVGGGAVTMVIGGTGFTSTSTVNFNGVSYPQTTSTATSIEALIPASAFTTVGSFPVTVTNTAGTSNAFTFTVNNPTTAGAFEDFETGTKTGYAAASVVLASGSWTFSDALIGTAFNDRSNGLKSARIRVGFIRMDFDKPNGAGTVIVRAGTFGVDPAASFILEKSTDGGVTFTTVPGAPATLTATLTPYTFTVNQTGNVRFRITSTATAATTRINIDDISITNYTGTATAASQALPGLSVFPNPATDRITVALPTAGAATVALRDLTGRVVLAPATLGADKQLVLPATLARGIYLLEVKQGDVLAVRRIEKN